ncbi:MAG: acyl-CoA thioesterase [Pseudomonadales bacterium]|nr:acyl-CoA thioesterase [Pseudomonadales bacterium]
MWFLYRFIMAQYVLKIKPTKHILDWVISRYRVMPWDLDANLHMNNVKYLKYLERGRVEQMIHTPWLNTMWANHAKALIANTEISYVKEMRLFQKFKVETRISSWDEKYIYMEQLFTHRHTVFTAAVIRMAVVDSKTHKRLSPAEAFNNLLGEAQSPAIPTSAQHLNLLVQAQRGETQAVADAHAAQDEPQAQSSYNPKT